MKCTIAVVFAAAVCVAQASVVPLVHGGVWGAPLAYTAQSVNVLHGAGLHGVHGLHGGVIAAGLHGVHGLHGLHGHDDGQWVDDVSHHGLGHHVYAGAWDGHHDDGQWHGDVHHDAWGHGHGHAAVVTAAHHAVPVHVAHEGSYVAANRGSVHVAPLAGHIQSASSINLQPAPGTL